MRKPKPGEIWREVREAALFLCHDDSIVAKAYEAKEEARAWVSTNYPGLMFVTDGVSNYDDEGKWCHNSRSGVGVDYDLVTLLRGNGSDEEDDWSE